MSKHTQTERILVGCSALAMMLMFVVQAQVVLRRQPEWSFSLERMNIAYGYDGTDECADITFSASFEDGVLSPFTTSGDASWTAETIDPHYGHFSATNGTIMANQSVTMTLEETLSENGIIGFSVKTSSEAVNDTLGFYIDGVLQRVWSGSTAWSEVSFNASSGDRTFIWVYSKNATTDTGMDKAWVDMVRIGEGDCGEAATASSSSAASSTASSVASLSGPAYCGDGVVNSVTEQCEPPGSSGCSLSCQNIQGVGSIDKTVDAPDILVIKRRPPPPNCGNGKLEKDKGEKCDLGLYNGFSPDCDRWCGETYCGDGKVFATTEECEPEQDQNGSYIQRSCGGKSCTIPTCDAAGNCAGGCRWTFLPACKNTAPLVSASGSAASDASADSSAVMTPVLPGEIPEIMYPVESEVSSALAGPVEPVSSAPVTPAASASSVAPSAVSSASSASVIIQQSNNLEVLLPIIEHARSSAVAGAGFCGDGRADDDEECDMGANNSNVLADACRTSCQVAACGDRIVDTGEQCDDGNDIVGDGCTPICTLAMCGNGALERGEECDEGRRNNDIDADSCSTQCLLPRCGDAIVDPAFGEICDAGEFNSNTMPDSCRLNCAPSRCGDGIRDSIEQCDDGNMMDGDTCSSTCSIVACGNEIIDWNEQCDDGNTEKGDGCSSACTIEKGTLLDWIIPYIRLPFWHLEQIKKTQ
jgi:cysteine-rich repeat protein